MPRPDFSFPLDAVLAAMTERTRVVFLTNPNNPTGVSMPLDAIRTLAGRVPHGAVVFVDEAYAEFAGDSFISEVASYPNVIVGRTFSKAFGPGVYIRDRSSEPGCAGCIRIGAGIVDHTRRCISVMEEVLCATP